MSGKSGELVPIEHGTQRGYSSCRIKRPEGACEPCRQANAEYHRARRASQAKARAAERAQKRARERAYTRLAVAHPAQFRQLLNEEMQRELRKGAA